MKLLDTEIKIVLVEPGMYHTGFNQVMLENKYDWMNEKSVDIKDRGVLLYFTQLSGNFAVYKDHSEICLSVSDLNTLFMHDPHPYCACALYKAAEQLHVQEARNKSKS